MQIPVDFLALLLAGMSAYILRFSTLVQTVKPVQFILPVEQYFFITVAISGIALLILGLNHLYLQNKVSFASEMGKIVQAMTVTFMLIIVYMFFVRENFSSRFIILFAWIFSIAYLLTARIITRKIKTLLYKNGIGTYRTIILGNTHSQKILVQEYQKKVHHGIQIIKTLLPQENIIKEISEVDFDMLIITDPKISRTVQSSLIDYCHSNYIQYKYIAGDFESKVQNTRVESIAGIPIIEVLRTPLTGWNRIFKRLFDIIVSIICIIITSPIMFVTAVLVYFDSKGPIFADTPPRAGLHGKPFKMFKFRSMYTGAHNDQAKLKSERAGLFKMKNDPRVTRVGKFIRKTSIDELPQFFNVLIGNMSMVGPRPHFLSEYTKEQLKVLDIKPGVTGLAQISGRNDLKFEDEIKLDQSYIENWNFWLDVWIFVKTPIVLVTKINKTY